MPPRPISFIPRHSPRRPNNPHTTSLRATQETRLTLDQTSTRVLSLLSSDSASILRLFTTAGGIGRLSSRLREIDTAILGIALGTLERALNARNEIKVPVEGGRGG